MDLVRRGLISRLHFVTQFRRVLMVRFFRLLTGVLLVSCLGWICWAVSYQVFEWWMILGVLPATVSHRVSLILVKRREERNLKRLLRRYQSEEQRR